MSGERRVRKPKTQNEHLWFVIKTDKLTVHERLIAHTLHALCYVSGGEREASNGYLADLCGMSQRTVTYATKKLVGLGLFDRLDNRKGGYRGVDCAAKYRPRIPVWWTGQALGTSRYMSEGYEHQ